MTPLIKDLVEQAKKSVPPGLAPEQWLEVYHTKFAELIVKECMTVCADNASLAGGANTQVGEDLYLAVDLIKKHFGVEE